MEKIFGIQLKGAIRNLTDDEFIAKRLVANGINLTQVTAKKIR